MAKNGANVEIHGSTFESNTGNYVSNSEAVLRACLETFAAIPGGDMQLVGRSHLC
jgi:hypothetical protein